MPADTAEYVQPETILKQLADAMTGDATLYSRQDMVEASWTAVQPILDSWAGQKFDFPNYPAGTWGPKASDEMLSRQGHHWRVP